MLKNRKKTRLLILTALLLAALAGFYVSLLTVPLPTDKLTPPQAYRFYDRQERLIAMLISEDEFFRMQIPLDDISPLFINTLLLQEDRYFYQHIGINPFSIIRAAVNNVMAGKIVSGGSTITMQLARMLERRKRTYQAKLIEAYRALQLEVLYSKEEILVYYLGLAPYGGNLEGVQAAAFGYFGKSAANLSIGEIALLAALPKSPARYRPDRHPEQAEAARNNILKKMLAAALISEDQYQRALREPIPKKRQQVKNLIPHLSWNYRLKQKDRYVWHTTLDENIHRRVHKLLRHHIRTLSQYHISNAAAVVIDNRTREVRALVGSVDYFSKENLGANDGSLAPRSPGSTLKPFLYGLVFQEGLIAEKTVLYDIPSTHSGYTPQNYGKKFIGLVRARDALTNSLNVVAVNLSKQLGIGKLHELLKNGGITTLKESPGYYGLPLILGGVEIRLIELVNLYASLADGGIFRPYHIFQGKKNKQENKRLLSREAAWLVTHILTDVERPDFPASWQFAKNRPTIAWKTGTSYGHRDAWSVGYTPKYTIGVWLGNFDGSASKALIGSEAAAPILFDLFQALQTSASSQWFSKPPGVGTRKVCVVCGKLANRQCQSTVDEFYLVHIEGPILHEICDIPQSIAIDTRTGRQADDTPLEYVEQRIFNIWPSDIATFLLKHGVPVRKAPPYNLKNMAGQKYYPPRIVSPRKNTIYYRRPDKLKLSDHGITLSAAVTNRIRKVYWFLDGELISETDPLQDVFINPEPGRYEITLADEAGERDKVELIIKKYYE
ncbi:MAG: penicillin-binding protein 1C [Gammaproteobacteria bacterium]|nr:penicillin-binding protein 1C [Gammaproteobacteria bacterium]